MWPLDARSIVAAALLLSGCGYVGDPLPPALHIPEPIADLRATQRGDRIVVDFTLPALTTEGLPVRRPLAIDLRIGPGPTPFNVDAWLSASQAIAAQETPGSVHVEAPAKDWYGREIVAGVRLRTDQDRYSEWSNLVVIPVLPPLAIPADVRGKASANGVTIVWTSPPKEELRFRILRKAEDEKGATVVATVDGREHTDTAVTLGKRYEYRVQAVAGSVESDLSAPATVLATDVFAPGVPSGLTAVGSLNSIELGWERNAEPDLAFYRVYRAEGNGDFKAIADKVEGPAFSDNQITSGTTYRYAVSAVDTAGNEGERTPPVQAVAP